MHQCFFEKQMAEWPSIRESYQKLAAVYRKEVNLGETSVVVQCNPDRIRSTAANISPAAIEKRPCFLCPENRPKEQLQLNLDDLDLLVNPFPVFPMHFTITGAHQPQEIEQNMGQMLELAKSLTECVVFYNGPESGASAPDHFHFQAGNLDFLPLVQTLRFESKAYLEYLLATPSAKVHTLKNLHRNGWFLQGKEKEELVSLFEGLMGLLKTATQSVDKEPMMNVLSWWENEQWKILVLPRKKHRPECFYQEGDAQFIVSPASVEMGGLIVTVRETDYQRIQSEDIQKIYADVCLDKASVDSISNDWAVTVKNTNGTVVDKGTAGINSAAGNNGRTENTIDALPGDNTVPEINVGIMETDIVSIDFKTPYQLEETNETFVGKFNFEEENGKLLFEGNLYEQLHFNPLDPDASFELENVIIGINFHWERKENQAFEGKINLIPHLGKVIAINRISVEKYLTSVISSEMSAHASLELLKAHAVISRSWLLSQIQNKHNAPGHKASFTENEHERIKWYDREDHTLFDVCADDHCQRYQGITKACTPQVKEAVSATCGEVLTYEDKLCDARFSKCCGGILETFENCWENEPKPYLAGLYDRAENTGGTLPRFNREQEAEDWILAQPDAFCNTQDKHILAQVLNNYDQETVDFYRWKVSYTTTELSELIRRKSGLDFGIIRDLVPLERGVSGRITRLKIVGSFREMIIGKELEIRKILSESHLYSSAFVVRKEASTFTLLGAGWGHGVGLCQIGAAVMSEKGYDYTSILSHYYPNTEIKIRYQAQ